MEPTEWPQGSQASSSVWREDSGLLSRPCRKRRPSPREDRGVSGVPSSCGARGGFLTRHDEDLSEPLVRRQGSQVSMRLARGIVSWLSSHGRGIATQDILKHSRGLSRVAAGNPRFPRLLLETLGNVPVPLRGEGYCGVGGASPPTGLGLGAMEEGLISRGGRNLRLPLRFGL